MTGASLYETLGVAQDATQEAIKSAYRKLAMQHHPDKGGKTEDFAAITLAYDVLVDPDRRAKYDETGETGAHGVDTLQTEAISLVTQMVDVIIAAAESQGKDPLSFDVIAHAEVGMQEQIIQIDQQMTQHEAALAKKQRLLGKFRVKADGKPNRIAPLIERQVGQFKHRIKNCRRQLQVHALALEILADHTFDFEAETIDPRALAAFYQNQQAGQNFR